MNKLKEKLSSLNRKGRLTSTSVTALLLGLVIVINVIVYVCTVNFNLYLYSTDDYDLTISGSTDAFFADDLGRGEKVTVLFCDSKDTIETSSDEVHFFHETALQFAERYPELIELEYVNIITKRDSSGNIVENLQDYRTVGEDGTVYPLYKTSVIFISDKNHRVIHDVASSVFSSNRNNSSTVTHTSYNGEEVFASMVSWVLGGEHKTAYFTTYHGEIVDVAFANMLSCSGYDIKTIDLRKNEIPDDAGVIIISNPKKDFERAAEGSGSRSEIEKLREYMQDGGRLYVAIDPYVKKLTVLEEFVAEFGISISESETKSGIVKNIVKDRSNAITTDGFTIVAEMADNDFCATITDKIAPYTDKNVIIESCAALELNDGAIPILVTSNNSFTYADGEETNADGNYCIAAKGSYTNKEGVTGEIFVVPSIFLTANDALVNSGYANRNFIYSLIDEAFGADEVPYGCNVIYMNTGVLENLTMGTARIYTAFILALPIAIAIFGAVVTIRRKNR